MKAQRESLIAGRPGVAACSDPRLAWKRRLARVRREVLESEEGASLVEMSLASVILFGTLFGIIFAGWALYSYDFVSDAAREAARYAIVRGSNCAGFSDCNATNTNIQTYVQGFSYPGIVSANLSTSTEWYSVNQVGGSATTITDCGNAPVVSGTTCNAPGNEVQVKVTYTYPFGIPFWNKNSITMTSTAELVISQ